MNEAIRKRIRNSLITASVERIDIALKHCKEDASITRTQAKKMSEALNIQIHWRPSAKKVIAILVAAVILILAGCGIIYRNEIRKFIINVYETFFDVRFENDNHLNQDNIKYELKYVPDGYVLNSNLSEEDYFLYENAQNDRLELFIYRLDTTIAKFDNEHEKNNIMLELDVGTVLKHVSSSRITYMWNDGYKMLVLKTKLALPQNEAEMIIHNILRTE